MDCSDSIRVAAASAIPLARNRDVCHELNCGVSVRGGTSASEHKIRSPRAAFDDDAREASNNVKIMNLSNILSNVDAGPFHAGC